MHRTEAREMSFNSQISIEIEYFDNEPSQTNLIQQAVINVVNNNIK